jgi:hypothetical protein
VTCPLSSARGSQGTGARVLAQMLGIKRFPYGKGAVSTGARQLQSQAGFKMAYVMSS